MTAHLSTTILQEPEEINRLFALIAITSESTRQLQSPYDFGRSASRLIGYASPRKV